MVDHDSVEPFPVVDRKVVCLFSKAEIREIAGQYLDLFRILLAESIQGSLTASNNHEFGLLLEQIMRNRESDTYR